MKKVLVLVLSSIIPRYYACYEANKNTWGKSSENFEVLYYFGIENKKDKKSVVRKDDCLFCDVELDDITKKTLMAIKYCYENIEFDYIFRCCCGSYVVAKELLDFVLDKPTTKFYCGIKGCLDGVEFAGGAGYFISRDCAKIVANGMDEILGYKMLTNHDDVVVGKLLKSKGICVADGARRTDMPAVFPENYDIEQGAYHYHLGTGEWETQNQYKLHDKIILGKKEG